MTLPEDFSEGQDFYEASNAQTPVSNSTPSTSNDRPENERMTALRHPRSPFWMHSSGYLNAESYFPSSHPFGRTVDRQARPFDLNSLQRMRPPSYINPFPRRGIGPRRPQVYLPSFIDPVYVYPSPQAIHPDARPRHPLYLQEPNSHTFRPYEPPIHSHPASICDLEAESIPSASSSNSKGTGQSQRSNEGSSESESVELPEHPVGTTPIFHPLPSMFHPLPRPLSFPISGGNKELPTLALFQNCSLESKVVGDYSDSHQELSLMLAFPGLSAHQAPLLSLQQAGDILQTINNPLVVLKVGRLTRKLVPNPALLKPTGDVGTLALWLSPTSDVRLFWHSFLKGPTSDSARDVEEQITQLRSQGEGSPYKELFSHVELSEELAWVAAESDQSDGGSGIRLEMMDHDPSGRSFKLTRKKAHDRQKTELASKLASEEGKTGQDVTEETQKLRQLLATCMSEDPEEEDSYFFWIAESSVSEGTQMLEKMQNRLDHLPTLAGESGVPEKKLQELYDWFSKAQQAASSDSTLSNEIASWIDLRSGASVPSQLFSNTCPANVPSWTESQPSTSDNPPQTENTIREGCALSATANFLVADKKWGLTHLATASVMVAVGVESTGLFYDEAKAHVDLSLCAHELAKKRAEAGASAEAERLGRIRLEELVAVKSMQEMRSNKIAITASKSELPSIGSQSEELIHHQQRVMRQALQDRNTRRPLPHSFWEEPRILPGKTIQGNSVLHHAHVQAQPEMVTHMPDYLRQRVHYAMPMDQHPSVYQPWRQEQGLGGNVQVAVPYLQYEHPSMGEPGVMHPHPWPYGNTTPRSMYRPFVPVPPMSPVPSFFPRHLPPQYPYLQLAQMRSNHRHKQQLPNPSLVRIAKEAQEKARQPRERVRVGPSGSNLAAADVDIDQDPTNVVYAWHDPAHQLGNLYRNTSLNVGHMADGENVSETRNHAETPQNTTAEDIDKT